MLLRIFILIAAAFALTLPAEANGATKRKVIVEREVVRVYEPRPAPPEPLLQLSILGTGLIISDDLDIDLFDIEERRRQLRQRVISIAASFGERAGPKGTTTMIESVIYALIYLALLVLVVYVVLWVLGELGIALPPQVVKIIWIIVALVAILIIVQTVLPGGIRLGPRADALVGWQV